MAKVFSPGTLAKFEDASASIPLRQLARAFDAAGIHKGDDPGGGSGGDRRTEFRRYISGVDACDLQQLARLGDALGSLIDEVATSKRAFLVQAAESDGFVFSNGAFRAVRNAQGSFAVTRVADLTSIDDRSARLRLLAKDSPKAAVAGAGELLESVCRLVLRTIGKPAPGKTVGLVAIGKTTLEALGHVPAGIEHLSAAVGSLGEPPKNLSRGRARLAVGVTVALANFIAETYLEG